MLYYEVLAPNRQPNPPLQLLALFTALIARAIPGKSRQIQASLEIPCRILGVPRYGGRFPIQERQSPSCSLTGLEHC